MNIKKDRTNDNAEVIIDSMPEHQTDAMARTLIFCVSRMFEDSRVKEDYERWKRKREEANGQPRFFEVKNK